MKEIQITAENQTVIKLIRKIEKFKEFESKELLEFLEAGKLREYQPQEIIIQEGASDCWLYFLISGTLEIRKGDHTISMLRRCGDMFGEMGIIDGSPRSATIMAHSKSLLVGFDAEVIERKLNCRDMNFCYIIYRAFAEVLAVRLRETTEKNVRLHKENQILKSSKPVTQALTQGSKSPQEPAKLKTVLIVDGMEATRKILRSLLRELKFKDILEAVDGESALKTLTVQKIDIIIADFNLTKLSGLDFIEKIRALPNMKTTPFIFLLNNAEKKKGQSVLEENLCHCLVKPYTANMLYEKLFEIMQE